MTLLKKITNENMLYMKRTMHILIVTLILKGTFRDCSLGGSLTVIQILIYVLPFLFPVSKQNLLSSFSSGFFIAIRETDNFLYKKAQLCVLLLMFSLSEEICACSVVSTLSASAAHGD